MTKLSILLLSVIATVAFSQASFFGWEFKPEDNIERQQYHAIVYHDGVAYAGSELPNVIFAINTRDGKRKWVYHTADSVSFLDIFDGFLVFQSYTHVGVLDLKDGSLLWNKTSPKDAYWLYKPLHTPHDASACFFTDHLVHKLELKSGKGKVLADLKDDSIVAQPIYVPDQPENIILPCDDKIKALNDTGIAWSTPLTSHWGCAPLYAKDTVYMGTEETEIQAFNIKNGKQKWSKVLDSMFAVRALAVDSTSKFIAAVSAQTVSQIQLDGTLGPSAMAPTNGQDTSSLSLLALDNDEKVFYLGDGSGGIFRFDIDHFKFSWLSAAVGASKLPSQAILSPKHLLVVQEFQQHGPYYAFAAISLDSGEYELTVRLGALTAQLAFDPIDYSGAAILAVDADSIKAAPMFKSSGNSFSYTGFIGPVAVVGDMMYFTAGPTLNAMSFDGQKHWTSTVPGANARSIRQYPPTVTNDRIFVVMVSWGTNDTIAAFNRETGFLVTDTPLDTSKARLTTGIQCTGGWAYTAAAIVSPPVTNGIDVYFTATTNCIYHIDHQLTIWATGIPGPQMMPTHKEMRPAFIASPALTGSAVVAVDSYQNGLFAWDLNNLNLLWGPAPAYTQAGGSVALLQFFETHLFALTGKGVTSYSSKDGKVAFAYDLPGVPCSLFFFYGGVFVTDLNGTIYKFDEASESAKLEFTQKIGEDFADLGIPAISPDGTMFFAAMDGVYSLMYNGTFLWKDQHYKNCTSPSVYQGVGYALCSGDLYLFDLYRGGLWLHSDTLMDEYATQQRIVWYTTQQQLSSVSLESVQLYPPGDLPKPLPPRSHPGPPVSHKSKMLLIVIGASIAGLVLIVVLVKCIASRRGGRAEYIPIGLKEVN